MGTVQGKLDFRIHNGNAQWSGDGGVTWTTVGSGVAMEDVIQTAGADTQDLTVTGLDGDADGDYDIDAQIIYKGGVGLASFLMRPFGASDSNLFDLIESSTGSGTYQATNSGAPNPSWVFVAENAAPDSKITVHAHITSKTGRMRHFFCQATSTRISTGFMTNKTMGWTTDTATNITALTIHSTVAASIGAGSFMKVRKLKSTL